MRWDGSVALLTGGLLCALGLLFGHEPPADAAAGGILLILGTGGYMALRHRVRFRKPGTWFVSSAPVIPGSDRASSSRAGLLSRLAFDATASALAVVGLSYLTGFWLTYMDVGVWALAIGAIKLGPGNSAIVQRERDSGTIYHVARRPRRGPVELFRESS